MLLTSLLLVPTANASAAMVKCRTDPIFLLSNGDVIAVTLDIGTAAANIRDIHYVLYVPAGITLKKVAFTALNLRLRETYQIVQDSPEKTYTTATIVTTKTSSRVEVGSMTRLNGVPAKYISGYSGQPLMITVSTEDSIGWISRN